MVCVGYSVIQVMENDDSGESDRVQESKQFVLRGHVKMVGGLIEQEDGGILRQGPRQENSLTFPTREGDVLPIEEMLGPASSEGSESNLAVRGRLGTEPVLMRVTAGSDDIANEERVVGRLMLRDDRAKPRCITRLEGRHICVADQDTPRVWL